VARYQEVTGREGTPPTQAREGEGEGLTSRSPAAEPQRGTVGGSELSVGNPLDRLGEPEAMPSEPGIENAPNEPENDGRAQPQKADSGGDARSDDGRSVARPSGSAVGTKPPETTPWGDRTEPDMLVGGFWWVVTASVDGGLYLTAEQRRAVPNAVKVHSQDGDGIWWEDKSAWSLPVICILSGRAAESLSEAEREMLEQAHKTAMLEHVEEWENLTGCNFDKETEVLLAGHEETEFSRDVTDGEPQPETLEPKPTQAKEAEAERLKEVTDREPKPETSERKPAQAKEAEADPLKTRSRAKRDRDWDRDR
jgi:hypothetical protein